MQHGALVVSTVALQQEGPGFNPTSVHVTLRGSWIRYLPRVGSFYVEFACSPRVCVSFLCVLRFPPTIKKYAHWVRLAQSGGALRRSGSGLTLHSNLAISLYHSLYIDNEAVLPLHQTTEITEARHNSIFSNFGNLSVTLEIIWLEASNNLTLRKCRYNSEQVLPGFLLSLASTVLT